MASEKGKCTLDLNTPSGEVKRKRGRPLKSQATRNLVLSPGSAGASLSVMGAVSSPPAMSAVSSKPMRVAVVSPPVPRAISQPQPAFNLSPSAENSVRGPGGRGRDRVRPKGSENLQMPASMSGFYADTAAADFTAHVIHVDSGEDVIRKIMSLVQNGPRGICVVSAYGTVSSALISHPLSSGGSATYEGQFQILSLTGSFTVAETGMGRCRTGGVSVSLACPDGHVIGGAVAGPLVAAGGVQVRSSLCSTVRI
ncbi:AT-hook motif nuclear-localized protein 1-like [Apium graveolens]|uniref:AT-hook motif nuclear-localized protein 1-like n=1 Tax=Apium graveolens TaxID=4045 RepID=UPI003D799286